MRDDLAMPDTYESTSSDAITDEAAFAEAWNRLERRERSHLRRLVRMGRSIDEPHLASLAVAYARHQVARPWIRLFWFWFVPGIIVILGIAAKIHPLFIGVTLALAGQALWAYISLGRTARTAV